MRFLRVFLGLMLILLGLPLAVAPLLLTGADNRIAIAKSQVSTDGVAIAVTGGRQDKLGGVFRVNATSTKGAPIFIGLGRTSDTKSYVAGAKVEDITSYEWRKPLRHAASPTGPNAPAKLATPGDQFIWVTQRSGPGGQSVTASLTDSKQRVMIMNVDGAPGVSAELVMDLEIPGLLGLKLGATAAGVLLVLLGLVVAIRRRAPAAAPVGWGDPTPPRRGRLRLVLAGLLALGLVADLAWLGLAAGGVSARATAVGAADPAITTDNAVKVLATHDDLNNKASASLDANAAAGLRTETSELMEASWIATERQAKKRVYQPWSHVDPKFFAPRQSDQPAWLVSYAYPNADRKYVKVLLFRHVEQGRPWRHALAVPLPEKVAPPEPKIADKAAQAVPLEDAAGLAMAPKAALDSYLKQLRESPTSGTFGDDKFAGEVAKARAEDKKNGGKNYTATEAWSQTPFAPVALRTADGGALVLATIEVSKTLTLAGGTTLTYKDGVGAALSQQRTFRKSTTQRFLVPVAMLVPPAGGSPKIIGYDSRMVAISGS